MATTNSNTATIGFEQQIWGAADILRGNMDAAEYKHVVLGLIFLKYISDKFEARYQELLEDDDDVEEKDAYAEVNVFFVPPSARWSVISEAAHKEEIGTVIDDAMRAIEKENKRLRDILPKNYSRSELDKRRLGDVVDLFTNIQMIEHGTDKDILGRAYEYCLARFAEQEGKRAGEFYTPSCVVRTLVEVLQPFSGRVYDPCCGSGGMFVQSADFVETHSGNINDLSVFGQDSNPTTRKMALMNLAIRGIEADLGSHNADTFFDDRHPTLKADYILANPMFNQSDWGAESLSNDPRWKYGLPPAGNANYAWLQHMIYHLAPNGKMGMVLANTALSVAIGAEFDVRKRIIEDDLVECIVSLPAQLFYTTKIKVSLWFINKNKNRHGQILFIDARNLGKKVTRTLKEFSKEDISLIASTVSSFQTSTGYSDVSGFCRVADIDEIRNKNHNIAPSKYISGEIDASDIVDYSEIIDNVVADLNGSRSRILSLKEEICNEKLHNVQPQATALDFAHLLGLPNIFTLNEEQSTLMLNKLREISELQSIALDKFLEFSESLFKYWFVDFNFPNADGLAYFDYDGEMKHTPYGRIPKNWDSITLGSVLQVRSERVGDQLEIPEYSTTNRGVQLRSEKFSRTISTNIGKNKIAYSGDLIFGMSREILNFGVMKDPIGGVSPAYHVYAIDASLMNPEFLEIYMRICSDYFLSLIKPGAREGQVLDKDEVQSKLIICPPLALQNQYMLIRKLLARIVSAEW